MEDSNIFLSKISLHYQNEEITKEYDTRRFETVKKRNIIYHSFVLLLALIVNFIIFYYDYRKSVLFLFIICLIYSALTLLGLTCSIFTNNKTFHLIMIYTNFVVSNAYFASIRYLIANKVNPDVSIFSITLTVELLFRVMFFVTGDLDFADGLFCFFLVILSNTLLIIFALPMQFWFRPGVIDSMIVITCIISYFIVREKRKAFYYNLTMEKKNDWYKSILENMSSGFVLISNGYIKYVNKSFKDILMMDEEIDPNQQETLVRSSIDIKIIKLLKDLTVESSFRESLTFNDIQIDEGIQSLDQIFVFLTKSTDSEESRFQYLGNTYYEKAEKNKTKFSFEVYGRKTFNAGNTYELLFKDITRAKQQEEINADFKYKTLFLSKVAHEFKNPVLCITELVEQVKEELEKVNETNANVSELLKQVTSISDYLIILIKDLDYFSQKTQKDQIQLEKKNLEFSKVKVKDIVMFCNNIAHCLIKKLNKEKDVVFTLNLSDYLPKYLYTDEVKLKQVLINLISNSAKYTYQGSITLSVEYNNGSITYKVTDTGKGISDTQSSNLFIPFTRDNSNSLISAGLGLYIVKDIVEQLGGILHYKSDIGIGSEFWFDLNNAVDEKSIENINAINESLVKELNSDESEETVVKEFQPLNINSSIFEYYHLNERSRSTKSLLNLSTKYETIIVVDDEDLTRRSAIRQLNKYISERDLSINVIEAADGIECIYYIYQSFKKNLKIKYIISDENMNFLNGSYSSEIIYKIFKTKDLGKINFYLLSAYENMNVRNYLGVKKVFSKPLTCKNLADIFEDFKV
jgi:signal transduction histidine kinase